MPYGDTLFQRLRLAKRADLEGLLGDLKMDPTEFRTATDEDLVTALSAELRSAAGNSIANVTRRLHDFSYKQILIDVADKLAPGRLTWTPFKVSGAETEEEIEDYIYERIMVLMEKHLKLMDAKDKADLQSRLAADLRARGFPEHVVRGGLAAVGAGTLTGIAVGPVVAAAVFGGGLFWSSVTFMQLVLSGVAGGGPAGIAVGAAIVVTGPSYSKTIPAVIRLIMIRLSHEAESGLRIGE